MMVSLLSAFLGLCCGFIYAQVMHARHRRLLRLNHRPSLAASMVSTFVRYTLLSLILLMLSFFCLKSGIAGLLIGYAVQTALRVARSRYES